MEEMFSLATVEKACWELKEALDTDGWVNLETPPGHLLAVTLKGTSEFGLWELLAELQGTTGFALAGTPS